MFAYSKFGFWKGEGGNVYVSYIKSVKMLIPPALYIVMYEENKGELTHDMLYITPKRYIF